jgi:hypothetical protein
MAHAQEDITQELDADLAAAFNITAENDSVNLTADIDTWLQTHRKSSIELPH